MPGLLNTPPPCPSAAPRLPPAPIGPVAGAVLLVAAPGAGAAPPAAQGLGAGAVVSVEGVAEGEAPWPRRSWKGFGPPMALRTGSWTSLYILWRMAWPPGMDSRFDIWRSIVRVISCSLEGFLAISIICRRTSGLFSICRISGFLSITSCICGFDSSIWRMTSGLLMRLWVRGLSST